MVLRMATHFLQLHTRKIAMSKAVVAVMTPFHFQFHGDIHVDVEDVNETGSPFSRAIFSQFQTVVRFLQCWSLWYELPPPQKKGRRDAHAMPKFRK
jgi:hypothetical protein